MLRQIERFAPGLRQRVVATSVRTPADLAADNANYVGGDIITGANTPVQVCSGPASRSTLTHRDPGVYICSATPPAPAFAG